jgi:hypothetical protein
MLLAHYIRNSSIKVHSEFKYEGTLVVRLFRIFEAYVGKGERERDGENEKVSE